MPSAPKTHFRSRLQSRIFKIESMYAHIWLLVSSSSDVAFNIVGALVVRFEMAAPPRICPLRRCNNILFSYLLYH